MRVRLGVIAALIGLGLALVATPAHGQRRKKRKATIDRGIALFNDLEYKRAIKTLEKALKKPPDDDAKVVEGYKALALSYLALGRESKTVGAFEKLLEIDPKYELPATLGDLALKLFEKARKSVLPPEPPKPIAALELDHTVDPLQPKPGTAVSMTITVGSDPDGTVRRVVVLHRTRGAAEYSSVWAVPTDKDDEYSVTISGSVVSAPALEYYLAAVDDTGEILGQLGTKDKPLALVTEHKRAASAETPIYGKWWFWAGIGGAVVATIVVASTITGDDAGDGASVTVTVNPPAP